MKTTTTIITALLCHSSIIWALPNSPHAPASTATERLQQLERQASSPSSPKILATTTSEEKTWQCDPIHFPDDLCLCVPKNCNLGASDCSSVYITKGALGCDQACSGCRPDECHQSLCNNTLLA